MKMGQLSILFTALALQGCNGFIGSHEYTYGPDKISPGYKEDANSSTSGVVTWPSYAVGAIVLASEQRACLQTALSAKARNSATEVEGAVAATLPQLANTEVDASGRVAHAISEAITALAEKDAIATFAEAQMFQLCTVYAGRPDAAVLASLDANVKEVMSAVREIAWARAYAQGFQASAFTGQAIRPDALDLRRAPIDLGDPTIPQKELAPTVPPVNVPVQ